MSAYVAIDLSHGKPMSRLKSEHLIYFNLRPLCVLTIHHMLKVLRSEQRY